MYEITCPSCKKILRIPEGVKESSLTCPRCLAIVDNPNVAIRAGVPGPPALPPETPTERGTCPSCGRTVEKSWSYCPSCDALLYRPHRIRPETLLEKETRVDTAAVGAGLVLLSCLGGLGIIVYFCGGPSIKDAPSAQAGTNGITISACLFAMVVVGMVLAGRSRTQAVRITTIVAGALTIPLLLLAGVISWLIYIAAGCHPGF
jgi:hypothetical protein